ncbi:hypothetical protein ACLOJK_008780 [Asimina triloba]
MQMIKKVRRRECGSEQQQTEVRWGEKGCEEKREGYKGEGRRKAAKTRKAGIRRSAGVFLLLCVSLVRLRMRPLTVGRWGGKWAPALQAQCHTSTVNIKHNGSEDDSNIDRVEV